MASSVFALGDILGNFFPGKDEKKFLSDESKAAQDRLTADLGLFADQNRGSLGLFGSDVLGARDTLRRLEPGDMELYGGMAKTLAGSDPLAYRRAIGDQNLNLFDALAKRLGSETTLSEKINSARLGYGERGPSTYSTTLIADRAAKNLAPILTGLFSNIGLDTSRALGDRRSDFGAADAAIASRASVPTRLLSLDLAPITARLSTLQGEQGLLGQGLGNYKSNFLGIKHTDNPWVGATKSIDKSLNSALDIYLSMYGGGLMGGGGGGGGGGIGSLMSMFGGGQGGGQISPQQTAQILNEFRGGSGSIYGTGGGYLSQFTQPAPNYTLPNFNYGGYTLTPGG